MDVFTAADRNRKLEIMEDLCENLYVNALELQRSAIILKKPFLLPFSSTLPLLPLSDIFPNQKLELKRNLYPKYLCISKQILREL